MLDEFPMLLVPGRVLAQEDEDAGVERIGETNHIRRTEVIDINAEDASGLGIQDGDTVEVVSAMERLRGVASVTEDTHQGVVAMTTLFGELATRLQGSEDPDPMAKVPGLVVRPVRLEKVKV